MTAERDAVRQARRLPRIGQRTFWRWACHRSSFVASVRVHLSFAHPSMPSTHMFRSAALPYVWMLSGAASFAVMAIFTVALKERVDWQWIAIARTGLAMTFAMAMAVA